MFLDIAFGIIASLYLAGIVELFCYLRYKNRVKELEATGLTYLRSNRIAAELRSKEMEAEVYAHRFERYGSVKRYFGSRLRRKMQRALITAVSAFLLATVSCFLTAFKWHDSEQEKLQAVVRHEFLRIALDNAAYFQQNMQMSGTGMMWDDHLAVDLAVNGRIAYDIPDSMEVDEYTRASVFITQASNDHVFAEANVDRRTHLIEDVLVSSRIKVTLMDPTEKCFEIKELSTVEQHVDDSTLTSWKWWIRPLRGGTHELILKVTIKLVDNRGSAERDVPVKIKSIYVNASNMFVVRQFFESYWEWFLSAIFLPLIPFIYNRINMSFKNRRIRQKEAQRTPAGFYRSVSNQKGEGAE